MSSNDEIITIPDIGTDDAVEVIEVNVNVGDSIEPEDTLITLESEKASMEIPAPKAGVVKALLVNVGDKVKTGDDILTLSVVTQESVQSTVSEEPAQVETKIELNQNLDTANEESKATQEPAQQTVSTEPKLIDVVIPDIGTDDKVDVIEVQVSVGDKVEAEDSLLTLESEKASMDIPAPESGVIKEIKVAVGDKVGQGDLIMHLETNGGIAEQVDSAGAEQLSSAKSEQPAASKSPSTTVQEPKVEQAKQESDIVDRSQLASSNKHVYASPSIRRFANDLGVDLTKIVGTGRKNRILKTDVENYVKTQLSKVQSGAAATPSAGSGLGLDILPLPEVDYSKFGTVQEKPLSRIKKLSAANLHRNWVVVPHVTQFDEADITDMEAFRQKYKKQAQDKGYKLTPLVFMMRAAAQALKLMPQFNVSLSNDGQSLIQKEYYHIGIAVDTPNGLVVPVVRDVDQKGLFQLAQELADISKKARDGKLTAKEMQGGCFTISSLGGIGGTAFTPIVNVPDVAILGISKSQMKPIYQDGEFVPRLMLPLSLSYDHRAIDGADAARFITLYSQLLGDISQLLL